MIMGLERLDRITAFMEEQSGPPRRSMGSVDTIPEKAQEGSSSGPASPQGEVNISNSGTARAGSKPRTGTTKRQMSGQCVSRRLRCLSLYTSLSCPLPPGDATFICLNMTVLLPLSSP